jgi:hypothetical protein
MTIIDPPFVCGHNSFPLAHSRLNLTLYKDSKCCTVPTLCPKARYKHPCGLGSTVIVNNVVLMYPDVNQYYMIPGNLSRAPTTQDQVAILCPCSSSSSASQKGLEQYVTSGVVCRCYYMMGIRSVLQKLCTDVPVSGCTI